MGASMKNRNTDLFKVAAVLFALMLITGCIKTPDKITRENYDKLKFGMSYEELITLIGEPGHFSTRIGIKEYTWVEDDRQIHAKLLADRAIYYSSKGLDDKKPTDKKPAEH